MATTALKGLFFSTQARRIGLRQSGLELGDAATGTFQLAVMKTLDRADASMRSERQPDPGDACRQTESDYKDEQFHQPSSHIEEDDDERLYLSVGATFTG